MDWGRDEQCPCCVRAPGRACPRLPGVLGELGRVHSTSRGDRIYLLQDLVVLEERMTKAITASQGQGGGSAANRQGALPCEARVRGLEVKT